MPHKREEILATNDHRLAQQYFQSVRARKTGNNAAARRVAERFPLECWMQFPEFRKLGSDMIANGPFFRAAR